MIVDYIQFKKSPIRSDIQLFMIHGNPRNISNEIEHDIIRSHKKLGFTRTNYVIDDELPKLSYLTLMDYIVLLSYVFAAFPSILSIVSHRYYQANKEEFLRIDKWAGVAGPSIFLILLYILIILIANINYDYSDELLKSITFN